MISWRILDVVNKNLEKLMAEKPELVIRIIKDINLPKDKKYTDFKNPIPSSAIVKKLISFLDEKEENIELSRHIISISFKFWVADYTNLLIQKCINILNYCSQQHIAVINTQIEMVLYVVEEMPEWIPEDQATTIANQLWALYSVCGKTEEKVSIMKSYTISVFSIPQPGDHLSNIITQIADYELGYLKAMFKFIAGHKKDEKWWVDLEGSIFQQIINNIINNPIERNAEKFEYLYKNKKRTIIESQLQKIFNNVIIHKPNGILNIWHDKIKLVAHKKSKILPSIVSNLQKTVADTNLNFTIERRKQSLDLLLVIIEKIKDESLNTKIGEWILTFVDINHLRQIASHYFNNAKILLGTKFNTYISTQVKNMSTSDLNSIVNQRQVMDIYITYRNNWDTEAFIFFADMLTRAVQSKQPALINMAFNYLQKLTAKEVKRTKKKKDLINAIESYISSNPNAKEAWEPILQKLK